MSHLEYILDRTMLFQTIQHKHYVNDE